jgi:hypothetical protein
MRPKYFPISRWKQFVVIDSKANTTVYGPDTRDACSNYINIKKELHAEK